MPGLDPGIHALDASNCCVDCRVKPGNDDLQESTPPRIACPTFGDRPIESQWIFLRLSHLLPASLGSRRLPHGRTSTSVFDMSAGMSAQGQSGHTATLLLLCSHCANLGPEHPCVCVCVCVCV